MRKLVYIAAAAVVLGAGGAAYTRLGPKTGSAPKASQSDHNAPKPASVQEAKTDAIAGALASSSPAAPTARPVVEPLRPPAAIPKPKIAAKPKQKVKTKPAVPPKKVV